MAKVAREMVEKAGVNVDALLELLLITRRGANHLLLLYNPTGESDRARRRGDQGDRGDGAHRGSQPLRGAGPRIYELGGKLPEDMKVFHDKSACPPASLPADRGYQAC